MWLTSDPNQPQLNLLYMQSSEVLGIMGFSGVLKADSEAGALRMSEGVSRLSLNRWAGTTLRWALILSAVRSQCRTLS